MFETNKEFLVLARHYAMEAVTHARETFNTPLDFSEESLFELEHILGKLHKRMDQGILQKEALLFKVRDLMEVILGKFIEKSMGESGDAIKSGQHLSLGFNPHEMLEPFGHGINVIRRFFWVPSRALKNIGILWRDFTVKFDAKKVLLKERFEFR